MRKIHFFKASSRLGIMNPPWGSKELNIGVEDAPEAILSADFLSSFFHGIKMSGYKFPKPEEINRADYRKILHQSIEEFSSLINDNLNQDETQVVVGGDHSVALPSVLAAIQRTGRDRLGYVQFDSHADLGTFARSPSGNFHGMFLRVVLDDGFDDLELNRLAQNKKIYHKKL